MAGFYQDWFSELTMAEEEALLSVDLDEIGINSLLHQDDTSKSSAEVLDAVPLLRQDHFKCPPVTGKNQHSTPTKNVFIKRFKIFLFC